MPYVAVGCITMYACVFGLQFYHKGIYDSPTCSRLKLNHAMLIVGYSNSTYRDYWIVKNRLERKRNTSVLV